MAFLRREQLAGMSIHYMYHSFDYFLQCQRDLGFKTIEMWGGAPHFLLDDLGCQDTVETRRKVKSYGLDIGAFTPESAMYNFLICAHDEYAHRRAMGYYKNGIRACGELGAKVMSTNCCGGDWNEDPDRTFERAANTLIALTPIAADNDVTLAVETVRPEESRIIATLSQLERLMKEVNHPNLKAALNLAAVGVAGETVKQWFETLGRDIVHTHFADGRPHGQLVWGDGLHPLEDYINIMNDYHYEGYLGQKITDGRYFANPMEADRRNIAAFEPFFE